ncbi:MAG: hypothetical protein JTJ17_13765 [Streptococcus gordonii]|jgi:hypothetical protein|nr:hypothetical protein [Streptococcus gordonii]MBR9942232.1 hypothetical protein [Lachnospiraceae bacterium Marseille-Q4251]
MRRDFDMIQFESRVEIGEVIRALEEWKETHKNDQKMETVQELINELDVMSMNW